MLTPFHWIDATLPDGSDGTPINDAELQRILSGINGRWSVASIALVGVQHNVNVAQADLVLFTNPTDLIVTGILAPASPVKPGKPLRYLCVGAGNVYFAHQNAGSAAGNKLRCLATSANTPHSGGSGGGLLSYDGTDWRLQQHEQGAYLTSVFSAANFVANGGMVWTVTAGNRVGSAFKLRGREIHYAFQLAATTVVAPVNTQLRISAAEWGSFSPAANYFFRRVALGIDAGTGRELQCVGNSLGSLDITRTDGANFTAGAGGTYCYGDANFPVL